MTPRRIPFEVPAVTPHRVEAVRDWVNEHRNSCHPLPVTSRVLATICALYEEGVMSPPVPQLAEALALSPGTVRKAIRAALNEGEIHEHKVSIVRWGVRIRPLLPSDELFWVYRDAPGE